MTSTYLTMVSPSPPTLSFSGHRHVTLPHRHVTFSLLPSTISPPIVSFSGNNGNNGNNNIGNRYGGNRDDNPDDNPNSYYDNELFSGLILYLSSRVLLNAKKLLLFIDSNSRVLLTEDVLLVKRFLLFIVSTFSSFSLMQLGSVSLARTTSNLTRDNETGNELDSVWEVSGGRRVKLVADYLNDTFVVSENKGLVKEGENLSLRVVADLWGKCRGLFDRLMLPEGYPESVTSDYLEYSLWRGVQGIAAQVNGVLATQSLLYAVGLGKGAIPTAAAVNWVLKDGIGYVSKIFLSKFGRHFDVNPKGWRLFADLLENAAFGMEILTPAFPHLFVPIGAFAGAGRSAAALIQAATRSCFFAGFAAQRNFAEVIAKGEAQGMVSKSIGIMLGIALANYIHTSTPLALATFGVVTWIHMFCNLKSYQAIQLRTLNPYRASLVFSEYLLSGLVPSVKEVNDEEPFFPALPLPILSSGGKGQSELLSSDAKDAAANIDGRLQLGSKLSDVVESEDDAAALFDLYKNEGYILTEHDGRYCVVLKESSLPKDMLKSLFHVNYLYWLEKNAGIETRGPLHDCGSGGKLRISLEYVEREFNHVKSDGELTGWMADSLIARPLPNRIRPGGDFALKG